MIARRGPGAKEWGQLPEAEKARNGFSPRASRRKVAKQAC